MLRTVLASAALVASAHAVGKAVVVNNCQYDVHMSNTPADGGGFECIDKVLSAGNTYEQDWTELSNGFGWSIKLAKKPEYLENVLQYEYTFHDDGIIWYDLSEVNGNPWSGNWEIDADDGCDPRQAAYRYATDDAYGMQDCHDGATITVTVCSGEEGGPAPPKGHKKGGKKHHKGPGANKAAIDGNDVVAPSFEDLVDHDDHKAPAPAPKPAPAAPVEDDDWKGPKVTVTNIQMATLTKYVTATDGPKRHQHHPRHPFH